MKEMVGGCCVCSDERGWPDNPLVYCDGNGCTVAVHQACYGIVTVPTGPWFCRKCENPDAKGKVRCELCPSKSGALKRSDTGGWAHVVCALYIPEIRFGNVTSMEPIVLRLIPPERYNKTCYICQEQGKGHRASAGACMQCNKSGCKQQFHVTCAQSLGLLCEEAGNYLDNVKYCGYCLHHYSKLKKGGNVKPIPPYKPVPHDSQSSDSSGEKEGDPTQDKPAPAATPSTSRTKPSSRKSSHSSSASGKSTPNPGKSSTSAGSSSHAADKSRKQSPSRRSSVASEGASGSKGSTPAPSPQHPASIADHTPSTPPTKGTGGSSGSSHHKVAPPAASPGPPRSEGVGVISAAGFQAGVPAPTTTCTSTSATASVVQATNAPKPAAYQETVITNTESVESKQTKKRKAVNAANSQATDYRTTPSPTVANETNLQNAGNKKSFQEDTDVNMESVEKVVKKAKTEENIQPPSHFSSVGSQHPPARSPSSHPSPRHPPSPMAGPSGLNTAGTARSPSRPQGKAGEREAPMTLLVSVPLPSSSQGLNLSAAFAKGSGSTAAVDISTHASMLFHQAQKQAAMESSVSAHAAAAAAAASGRGAWSGLNVSYESQQTDTKASLGAGSSGTKDAATSAALSGSNPMRKKRAAMATSVGSMQSAGAPHTATSTAPAGRRPPQPPGPAPLYQETIKDSPPSSPSSDRPLKPKMENKLGLGCAAPHMLGNELNPESGAAARLQEQLSAELAAHAAGGSHHAPLLPPPLINKASQFIMQGAGGGGGTRGGPSGAQSLDQLLERQWEQGSQFLMEQAQHFDIASLLSCLHQLRTENVRLEEHVGSLLQRRDHLLAVNARLAIPLTANSGPPEPRQCPRENGGQMRAPQGPVRPDNMPADRSHQVMVRDAQPKPS